MPEESKKVSASSLLDVARADPKQKLALASDVKSGDAVARAELVLGRCYLALGQPAEARPLLQHSHQVLLGLYGPENTTTREAAEQLRRLDAPG